MIEKFIQFSAGSSNFKQVLLNLSLQSKFCLSVLNYKYFERFRKNIEAEIAKRLNKPEELKHLVSLLH